MNRFIQSFNFLGVVVLAVLCAAQWNANSQLNHDVDRLEQTRLDQSARLAEQEKALSQTSADMEDCRQRLSISESALKDAQTKLAASVAERDQLKANLDKWMAAVAARDDALKQAGGQIQKLSAERNDAVQKYNDLVGKYNALISSQK